ncbi:MAG: [FeFe] hydrogenase H-cluster radical SAM maturase HydE [Bacteroidales bacterium]|nr:[FeFe] hydrogenase H-cluster radical SAM maturase HydE [Bacteroidales bacterium]
MDIFDRLRQRIVTKADLQYILTTDDNVFLSTLREQAQQVAQSIYGTHVFIRGLIEISSYCKNDCLYCGLRRSNHMAVRYRLSEDDIYSSCEKGHKLGFRTFVMQGGEDAWFNDERLSRIISNIRQQYPDSAITLSLGERSRESYQLLFEAGANRYLLRHETADGKHYAQLHPAEMSFDHRMQSLHNLKEIGYQVGCGFMVGSPGQTVDTLLSDLQFILSLQPQMVGIGPFVATQHTPFASKPSGSVEHTLRLLSVIRLLQPHVLLPATTALGTLHPQGRELGILHGANVIMPNLSPLTHRKDYNIYDNKICTGDEAAEALANINRSLQAIGYKTVVDRGDYK